MSTHRKIPQDPSGDAPLSISLFIVLSFALSWAAWAPLLMHDQVVHTGFGWPLHLPGVLGPALAAVIAARSAGPQVWADLVIRMRRLPTGVVGWAVALSPIGLFWLAQMADRVFLGQWFDLAPLGPQGGSVPMAILPALALIVLLSGLGEELGWRCYLLPRLQARFGILRGTLLLWPVWALWHLPLFFFLQPFMAMSLPVALFGWGLGLLAMSVVLARVGRVTGGSLAGPALWHGLYHAVAGSGLGHLAPLVSGGLVGLWALVLVILCLRGRPLVLAVPPVGAA